MADEKNLQQEPAEEDDDLVLLEDENGDVTRFQFLELVTVDAKPYAVLLPLDDNEDGGVVIVEVVDLGKETEHYDAVLDDALGERVFEQFRKEFSDSYEFG
ncbi:MAG: DUF1292 domain-containing protein [Oscillospiraceae bacterium]|nr:DUF1292 domain-containing protein [Oscillospiraceae bacterium]